MLEPRILGQSHPPAAGSRRRSPLAQAKARRRCRPGSRSEGEAQGQGRPHQEAEPRGATARLLHGPADRRRDVVGGRRLALPRDPDRGRTARGHARRPQDPAGRDRGRRRCGRRLPQHPHGAAGRPQGDACWPPTCSPRCSEMLRENAREAGVKNIKPIRATQLDTKLPEARST